MHKPFLLFVALIASVAAFAPETFGIRGANTVCFAKHAQDKAAKWAKAKRPRKSRPSDINRTPVIYEIHSLHKPAEYSISDEAASPMPKPEK